ncbi:glycoside hydrolase family 5 protein [Cylindrobasidium torrendii FP15055 ss-10]|uniref:cellulase n=1 Tax=Cylindrobasidium torrendii FP15055 ss-10 TaxID=1314674 RepID=A0A0D7BIK3_9AGAR|nr:glycoside hydrolase family 5 protein [Cylindrobasidium torrendii FP15055 ss-10]
MRLLTLRNLVASSLVVVSVSAQGQLYAQCGGSGWSGSTACVSGATCTYINDYYSQCLPGSATVSSTTVKTSSTSASSPSSTAAALKYVGVNIAGFDFGCATDGTCVIADVYPPLSSQGGNDGEGQMKHFFNDDGFNTFRLPVGWQFLTNGVVGGTLNDANFQKYDQLVQACLRTGATCIIDIHNYARWNGGVIGQGGPTNEQFAALWTSLAGKYKSQSKVWFGVVNEPHDVADITAWGVTVQAVVTAIRNAGATTQNILLPGNNWASAAAFVSSGSAAALKGITNPDGTNTGLIFDVHKYLDSDNSGTHTECTTNNISEAWEPLSAWLRANGNRQIIVTETGGGNTASCVKYMCEQIKYQAKNSDVILGYVGWSAGNFANTYELSEVPTLSGSTWTDTLLVKSCMAPIAGAQN